MSMLVQVGGGSCFVTFTQTTAPHNFSMHIWEQIIWHKFERVIQHWEMSTEESRARSEFVQVLGADEQQPTRTGLPLPTPDGVPGHYSPWSTCNTQCMLGEAHIQNFKKVTTSQNLKNARLKNNAWALHALVNLQHCMHCFINSSSSWQEIF